MAGEPSCGQCYILILQQSNLPIFFLSDFDHPVGLNKERVVINKSTSESVEFLTLYPYR